VEPEDITQLNPGEFAAGDSSGDYAGLEPESFDGPSDPSTIPVGNLSSSTQILLPVPTPATSFPSGPSVGTTTTTTSFAGDLDSILGVTPANTDTTSGGDVGDLDPILGSALGGLLGSGLTALNGLLIAPAVSAAALPGQTASAQLAAESQAASSATVTSSITTIILWGALAYGLVIIFSDAGRRV
jgi:hypothetical protein